MSENIQSIENQINDLQNSIETNRKKIVELRKQIPEESIDDYVLKDISGQPIRLSDLFEDKNELLVVHNMGKSCVYCTMWADGLNGLNGHLNSRMPFVVISPDDHKIQKTFSQSRNWDFKMISAHQTNFIKDLGFETESGHYHPGVSALIKKDDGSIVRVGKDYFGPGDLYNAAWHFYDLFPKGSNNWNPKYEYNKNEP